MGEVKTCEVKTCEVTNLVILESKQLFPKPVPILLGPFLGQEIDDSIMPCEESITIPPNGILRVRILHGRRVPKCVVNEAVWLGPRK
jgi:hypothetical protein